jgi:hypothetical protein
MIFQQCDLPNNTSRAELGSLLHTSSDYLLSIHHLFKSPLTANQPSRVSSCLKHENQCLFLILTFPLTNSTSHSIPKHLTTNMCEIYVDQWLGCIAKHKDLTECSKYEEERPCGKQGCSERNRRIDYRNGICPDHTAQLSPAKQQKAEEYNAKSGERWNNGERRVYNYAVNGKPNHWKNQSKCVML